MKDTPMGAETIKLNSNALSTLPQGVDVPRYDRHTLTPGIVHVGLGNFHRAHQAWYLHRLMQMGEAHDWAIMGAGVRSYDTEMRERLLAQDCLTTLIELRPDGRSAEIIGSMIGYIEVAEGNGPLISAISAPAIRIVSLTVTEGGYYIDPATGEFDTTHPDIVHDANNPSHPVTVFGAIIAALKIRRDKGIGSFTAMCCDNLQGNGDILRQTVVSLAQMSDPELAQWIEANTAFPNTMVDCIVPATGPDELALVREFGIEDHAPVTHENFRQWVIEDKFCAGRPDWDKIGATFTDNVHAYEAMKIRILNAGHQVVANAGELLSAEMISDCMENDVIRAFFTKVEIDEIVPYVTPVPDITPSAYLDLIAERFSNPAIKDTTRRVAFDGYSRHTGFLLPIVRDAIAAGGSISGLALVEALWARMCAGTREDGSEIEPNDPFWERLNNVALEAKTRPLAWLEQSEIYGDLAEDTGFAEAFTNWLTELWDNGTEATLRRYIA